MRLPASSHHEPTDATANANRGARKRCVAMKCGVLFDHCPDSCRAAAIPGGMGSTSLRQPNSSEDIRRAGSVKSMQTAGLDGPKGQENVSPPSSVQALASTLRVPGSCAGTPMLCSSVLRGSCVLVHVFVSLSRRIYPTTPARYFTPDCPGVRRSRRIPLSDSAVRAQ